MVLFILTHNKHMKNNTFLKGATILIICNLIGKILGAVYRIPLAKILGPVGIGMYQLIFPLYCLLLTVSTSGMPVAISKLVAEYNSQNRFFSSKKILKVSLLILTVVSLFCAMLVIVASKVIAKIQGNINIYICYYGIAPAILFVGILSALRGYFQGNLIMFPTAISSLIEQIVKMIFGLFLAGKFIEFGIEYAVLGAVIGISVSEIVATLFLMLCYLFLKRKKSGESLKISESFKFMSKQIFALALPVTLGGLVSPITSMIDSLIVVNLLMFIGFSNSKATSLLGIQSGIVEPLVNIPVIIAISISTAILPNISKFSAEKSNEKVNDTIIKAFQITLSISLACAICFVLFGKEILLFLYGSNLKSVELVTATKLLFLGSFNVVVLSLVQISSGVLQGLGYTKKPLKSLLVGSVVKIVFDVVLVSIKSINIFGVIISAALCYLIVFRLNYKWIKAYTSIELKNTIFYVSIQTCFVCLFAFVSNSLFSLILSSFVSALMAGIIAVAVFFVTYYIFFIYENKSFKFKEKNF